MTTRKTKKGDKGVEAKADTAKKVSIKEQVSGLFAANPEAELSTQDVIGKLPDCNPGSVRFILSQLRSEGIVQEARRDGHMSVLKAGTGTPRSARIRLLNTRSPRARRGTFLPDDKIVQEASQALSILSSLVKRASMYASQRQRMASFLTE